MYSTILRTRMLFDILEKVEGHLSWGEGFALNQIAAGMRVVEFGSFCGRSTLCMGCSAKRVVAVDHHQGDEYLGPTLDARSKLERNLAAYPEASACIEVFHLDYHEFRIKPGEFDVGFFDADHGYDATVYGMRVMADIPIVCVHDYLGFDTTKRAVDDLRNGRELVLFDSMAVLFKKG